MSDPSATPRPGDQILPRFDDRSKIAAAHSSESTVAICRICRGEGTSAEPLFYPCKCSGSIKYVHQDCLMEWLSHSQKKYCELCKTSFRFTKLYAPDMPQSLPVHIFLEHMAKYLLRNMLVWLRAVVTVSVWVCWLPYCMRAVWSFMFWVSDEGLGSGSLLSRGNNQDHVWLDATVVDSFGTCPASPLLPSNNTTPADAAATIIKAFSGKLSNHVLRILLGSIGQPTKITAEDLEVEDANSTLANATYNNITTSAPHSLLSDVGFLRNLTRSSTVNRTIITVLEGQLITILVIVCFILVILVRDYVVQQQPEINLRAAFANQENNVPVQAQPNAQGEDADAGAESDEGGSDDETLDAGVPPLAPEADSTTAVRATVVRGEEPGSSSTGNMATVPIALGADSPVPDMAELDAADDSTDGRASVIDYLRIYRQADGNLERILQIVQEEGLEEKLGYWVDVTRRSLREREATSQPAVEGSAASAALKANGSFTPTLNLDEFGYQTPSPSQFDEHGASGVAATDTSAGKQREWAPMSPVISQSPGALDSESATGSSRPRAWSDGPERPNTTHPLANNSWSFANLPPTEEGESSNSETHSAASPPDYRQSPNSENLASVGHRNVDNDSNDSPPHSDSEDDARSIDVIVDVPEAARGDAVNGEPEQAGLAGRVANFMWGGLDHHQEVERQQAEQQNEDDAADAEAADPWVDVPLVQAAAANAEVNAGDVDAGAAAAAAAAGLDAEAMEDLEDFEGVMELLGMRGPIAGLFQNAVFCAVLVSVTIFACIFTPYNIGRITLWVFANPVQLAKMMIELSKVVQDIAMMLGGFGSWCALNIVDIFTGILGGAMGAKVVVARKASWGLWTGAGTRVVEYALMDFPLSASEMQNFSAISHEALNTVKGNIGWVFSQLSSALSIVTGSGLSALFDGRFASAASHVLKTAAAAATAAFALISDPSAWVIDLGETESRPPVNPELAYWPGMDRFWAILAGYMTVFALGALYLKRGSPFSRGDMMQAWEAGVIDTLHQASGIMKVILIISIEMLVFPLYCGLLLDAALLPLFEDTTFKSRILFTYNYPLTSIFVHWFVGTGYMFHFALFVSMCRKIMRPGVLYFIRDPDDPEFHPVRDVLERNLTTQLRKILFSAFVYGALVIVCLGGVVWGLAYTMPGVLPVHYSSNEPVLEFPVDLLFYNFLMPLAVKFFKPSDGLHAMYTWWFRKCARGLRLTYFLFGERRIDEEGNLQLGAELRDRAPPHQSILLELDENNTVIPKTWRDTFEGGDAKPNPSISSREMREMRHNKAHLVHTNQLVKSGKFVRAPASDRVKIPKGQKVFLTVSERGHRRDGNPDNDLYASTQYQLVYVPPNFRARVFLFILFIWLFAAITGVGFTVAPLVLGRAMFKTLIPSHIRTNDIYAFSIGIYILGSAAYFTFRLGHVLSKLRSWLNKIRAEFLNGRSSGHLLGGAVRGVKLLYVYFFLLVVCPLTVSALMELYVSIPLHTYMNPPPRSQPTSAPAQQQDGDAGRHTVRVIQAWTLGLLYLNLATRMISSMFPDTRAAIAVRSVMRRGYLQPDIAVLTRAFVVPGIFIAVAAVFGPPLMASLLIKFGFLTTSNAADAAGAVAGSANLSLIYRYSYPAAALAALVIKQAVGLTKVFNRWTAGIRDEAYLIGERLHNFGAATAGSRKARRAWGAAAGGGRL